MNILHFCVVSLTLLLLGACGGGGGSNGGSTNGNGATSEPLVPSGTPVLFVVATFQVGGTNDEVNRTAWEFVPARDQRTRLFVSDSFSFARTSLSVFTFDDRLAILRNSGTSGSGGGDWRLVDVAEKVEKSGDDLDGTLPVDTLVATEKGTSRPNCVALSDTALYWTNADGALVLKSDLLAGAGTAETVLFPAADSENCRSVVLLVDGLNRTVAGMDFAEGTWYSVDYDSGTGLMEFFTRDLGSGATSPTMPVATFTPADHASYSPGYAFGFDQGAAYWARVRSADGQIEVWRFEFAGTPQMELAAIATGLDVNSVSGLDVDDGVIVFRLIESGANGFNSTNIVLFDSVAGTTELIDLLDIVPPIGGLLPPTFGDVQIMLR